MARQKRHFTASHKSLYAEGTTKAEASANLEKQIDWALEHRPLYTESRFGYLIVIAASASGYEVSLIDPASMKHGDSRGCHGTHGQIEFKPLLQAMRMHASQNAWTPDRDDWIHVEASGLDQEQAAELRRWIAWQRRYAEARANGANDGEAHRQACMAA